jgi:serine/threonine protein kinase
LAAKSDGNAPWPERIGRYRIVRPLSKGGMALVFEARRETAVNVAPRVALKVILPDYAASETFRELFINEARLGAAMHHQNLVQIQDFGQEGERFYLVMEYVEGLTLSKLIATAARFHVPIPLPVVAEIGRQVCEGLHYAHQATDSSGIPLGLVHRDIKPSNLIINRDGTVKILDFGISKGSLRAERVGSVKGTWGYMAPEQAEGEKVRPQTDLFSLAIVLWEMASRRTMFKGKDEAEIKRLLQADHAERMASALEPPYAPLARVLGGALKRLGDVRYANAAEFGQKLANLLPDPLTAREETVRFVRDMAERIEEERVAAGQPGAGVAAAKARAAKGSGQGRPSASSREDRSSRGRGGERRTLSGVAQRPVASSALAGLVAVGVLVWVGQAVWAAVNEPARAVAEARLPSGTEARPAPVTDGRPPPVDAARLAAPPPASVPAAGAVAAGGAEAGMSASEGALRPGASVLVFRTVDDVEFYLDGKLVSVLGEGLAVASGGHVVMARLGDGRTVTRRVDAVADKQQSVSWDVGSAAIRVGLPREIAP